MEHSLRYPRLGVFLSIPAQGIEFFSKLRIGFPRSVGYDPVHRKLRGPSPQVADITLLTEGEQNRLGRKHDSKYLIGLIGSGHMHIRMEVVEDLIFIVHFL